MQSIEEFFSLRNTLIIIIFVLFISMSIMINQLIYMLNEHRKHGRIYYIYICIYIKHKIFSKKLRRFIRSILLKEKNKRKILYIDIYLKII